MRSIPDFTRPEWHRARTNDRLVRSIREGRGSMPAMKGKLGETEVVQLVSLVRKFRDGTHVIPDEPDDEDNSSKPTENKRTGSTPSPGSDSPRLVVRATSAPIHPAAEAGRRLFSRFCVACHGADGHGSAVRAQMPWIPDFASSVWQGRRTGRQIATVIVEGKGTAMPTFRDKLNDSQVRDIFAHLRTLAPLPASSTREQPTDFKQRFQQLKNEMDDLKRQYRDLAANRRDRT
jgi:mono/diheme cytochrome c family protein